MKGRLSPRLAALLAASDDPRATLRALSLSRAPAPMPSKPKPSLFARLALSKTVLAAAAYALADLLSQPVIDRTTIAKAVATVLFGVGVKHGQIKSGE